MPFTYLCPSCMQRQPTPGKCRACARQSYRQDKTARLRSTKAWQVARAQAKRRDGHRCTVCGGTKNLEVHHIVPLEEIGAAFDLSNLATLCTGCHPRGRFLDRQHVHVPLSFREKNLGRLPRDSADLTKKALPRGDIPARASPRDGTNGAGDLRLANSFDDESAVIGSGQPHGWAPPGCNGGGARVPSRL